MLSAFLQSDAVVRGIRGPYGSGKSTCCTTFILDKTFEQEPEPDGFRLTRWGIIRPTYGELRTTTLKDVQEWTKGFSTTNESKAPIEHQVKARLPDGTIVDSMWYLIALDREEDVRKLLSMQLTGAWINEAREAHRAVLRDLRSRVGRYPRFRQNDRGEQIGGPTWWGVLMDTNSPDDESWWYEYAEKETPEGWAFFAQPSGLSAEAENTRWLRPGYYEDLCLGAAEDWIRVHVRNEYGKVVHGRAVYAGDYVDAVHCPPEPISPNRELPLVLGTDFGWSAATVLHQVDGLGRWDAIDEHCTDDRTTQQHADEVIYRLRSEFKGFKVLGSYGDPAGQARRPEVSEDQPQTHIEICRAAGLDILPAPSNDLRLRIETVAKALRTLVGGRPRFRVSKRCVSLRRGMSGRYRFPSRHHGGYEVIGATPIKNEESHPCEASQYAMLGHGEGAEVVRVAQKGPPPKPTRRYGAWSRR